MAVADRTHCPRKACCSVDIPHQSQRQRIGCGTRPIGAVDGYHVLRGRRQLGDGGAEELLLGAGGRPNVLFLGM